MIDTHAHLNDEELSFRADEIIANDYLEYIIVPGYDFESSKLALSLANKYEKVYATLGCHPHDAEKFTQSEYDFYLEKAKEKKVVAIGEIGLDYYRDLSPRDIQKEVFIKQIELADKVKLPIVLHVRDAYKDTLDILSNNKDKLNSGVLLHCYSGSKELVREFMKFDAYFAFGGAVTYKGANKADIIKSVPMDRLLLETDCPYMTPVPYRGKTNEPKLIEHTAIFIASVLGIQEAELEKVATENAKRFFGIK